MHLEGLLTGEGIYPDQRVLDSVLSIHTP
jgi:hypothetical protein